MPPAISSPVRPPLPPPVRAFRRWVVEVALPFWLADGFDPAAGRFHERLDLAGRPVPVPQRAMVQARQLFVYAEAGRRGWLDPGKVPARALATLLREQVTWCDGVASAAFAVHPTGGIAAPERDAYTHAFLLLACAALYGWTGDPAHLALADALTAFIERALVDASHGGLFDRLPGPPPFKRQNPVMHLLEAYLALAEVAPAGDYRARAAELAHLFEARLLSADGRTVREYFAADWQPHADPALGRHYEPGHHFEWLWLLERHARGGGRPARSPDALFAATLWEGRSRSGLLHDQVDAATRRPSGAHRLWPHAEAMKAALGRAAAGDATALSVAAAMAAMLDRHFCGRPFAAGWIDRVDRTGAPLVDHVPASSLYHLVTAAIEIDRYEEVIPPAGSR